jgi:hypothetical protein
LWGSDVPRLLASFINYLVLLDSKHHIETVHMVSGHSLTRDSSFICSLHWKVRTHIQLRSAMHNILC